MIKAPYTYRGITKKTIFIGLIFLILCFFYSPVLAQKKENKTATVKKKMNEEIRIEQEYYFIESEKYFILENYSKAYEGFQKVLKIAPNNAAANFKCAQILSNNKEYRKALDYILKAKNKDDKNKYYYLLLINIYTNLAQLDNAIATYKEILEKVNGTERYLFDLATLQLYQKQYDDALDTYDKAKEHFGIIENIVYQKQQTYLKQNKLDLAILEGQKLINTNPSQVEFTISLAQILMANDKLEETRKMLEKFISDYGDDDRISVFLAEMYRKSGAVYKALKVLIPVFKNNTTSATSKIKTLAGYMSLLPSDILENGIINLAEILTETHPDSYKSFALTANLYLNLGKKIKAKENYEKALQLEVYNYNIWQNIISLEMELGNYDEVIKHSEQALEIFPNQAVLYYFGGSAYLIKKEYGKAVKVLNAGKFYTNSDLNLKSIFFGQLGDAYNGLKKHKKSDSSFEEALKAKPDNDHTLNNYSYFLSLRKEKLDLALDMSSKLIKKYPENATYLDTHAWVLYMMKDYITAKKYLEKAIKGEPNSTIIEHYGDVLFHLGDIDQAIVQWKKAKAGTKNSENLDKKITNRQLYE